MRIHTRITKWFCLLLALAQTVGVAQEQKSDSLSHEQLIDPPAQRRAITAEDQALLLESQKAAEALTATLKSLDSQNFPFIYMNVAVDTFGQGFPGLQRADFAVFENEMLQTDYFDVIPPEQGGGVRLADIVFLMDNSGSMGEEITAVRENMIAFVNQLATSGVDFALGLCRFGAKQNSGYPILEDNGVLTTDANDFKNRLWARNVIDGGFEPGWDALYDAATGFNFRPGAQKVFILITDESVSGDKNRGRRTKEETTRVLQDRSVLVFALINDSNGYAVTDYGTVARATGGDLFNITRPFDDILDVIGEVVANTYVVTYRSTNPAFDGTRRNVRVRVTYRAEADTANGSYIPGAAPAIRRTAETLALHDRAWPQGTSFLIEAEIADNAAPLVQEARLYYKRTGEATYSSVVMTPHSGDLYRGSIPSGVAVSPGMDYYITASDGVTTSSDPKTSPAIHPHQIAILPNVAPVITHTPVLRLVVGTPVAISASIVDRTNFISSAKLFYRKTGQLLYQQQEMNLISGDQYTAMIPADYATTTGVDYYLAAEDDFGVVSSHSSADQPHRIIHENDLRFHGDRDVYFYPNPYNPFVGPGTFRVSSRYLPQVTIRIFDAANIGLRTILAGTQGDGDFALSATWDGSTGRGEIVGNGVYFYVIESSSGARTMGKIAVLR